MAKREAGLRIVLDGEKKFKEAVAEINRESKTLGAQMKKLAAEYKGNENSIEALTKKQTLLDRALLESKAKVEVTQKQLEAWRAALERVRQEQGASSDEYKQAQKKVQEYEYALATAETQQIKLENAIRENNQALKDSETALQETDQGLDDTIGKTRTLGDYVDDLAGKFGLKLPDGLKKSLDGMNTFSAGSVAAIGAVATAVTVAYKAYQKLNDLTLGQAAKADELLTKSATSGLSTTLLQQIEYAAPYIDVSADTIVDALKKITDSMGKANDGAEKQVSAFEKLGVSILDVDGHFRNANDVMTDVLTALSGVSNQTERNTIASDLLGRSYNDLLPLIENLRQAEQLYNEALEEGYVLSQDQLAVLAEVDDAKEHLTQTIEKNNNMIALQWAPTTKAAYEQFANLSEMAGNALIESRLIENVGTVITETLTFFEAGSKLIDKLPSWLNPIKNLSMQFELLGNTIKTVNSLLGISKTEMKGYDTLGSDIYGAEWKDDVQAWVSKGGAIIGPWNYDDFDKATGKPKTVFDLQPKGSVYSYGHLSEAEILKLIKSYEDFGSANIYRDLGYNAMGSANWRGGLTWVGEAGPELVSLPRGTKIYSHQASEKMGDVYIDNITIDAKNVQDFTDVVNLVQSWRILSRMM